jgi:hypothetical protein
MPYTLKDSAKRENNAGLRKMQRLRQRSHGNCHLCTHHSRKIQEKILISEDRKHNI